MILEGSCPMLSDVLGSLMPLSFICIQSKIKKRSWVLHECLERVPENVDAAKELLQYGLKGTDLEALVAIGRGADDGRWVRDRSGSKRKGDFVKILKPRHGRG